MTKTTINPKDVKSWKGIIPIIISAVLALLAGYGINFAINPTKDGELVVETTFKMELADEQVPTIIETEDGKIEVTTAPTVESVEADQVADECPEGEECGKGRYIYAPTGTPNEFKNYTLGGCWNTDDAYGAQCWDLGDLFWQNYAGRRLSTCGTGAAKGIWNCKEQNAGGEFELITDVYSLQAGDWLIFGNGTYGHVGMALGGYNNGYIALLGQNQGGSACPGGGSSANIINMSLNTFLGAFRPKSYIKPEPQPEPTPEPVSSCDRIEVKKGDTLGSIMLRCEGKIEWGKAMQEYAKTWKSTKVKRYATVYDGWVSEGGYGLFAGDVIEREK